MFLSIKKVPKTYWSSGKPFNFKPKFSTLFFLCFGLSLFGLGEGLLIVSFTGASPWSVLAQDTFAYYDTSFRILNGSAPFKDYWTVSGPFIDYLQATIFFFFGVSWKSYIIIGSILNSLITIIFYYTLSIFHQNKLSNLFYSSCFSVLANPSMGTPFPDHFSTFFSLAGIFFFLLAIKTDRKFFWFLIPIFFFFAFFCKQSPSSYILLVLLPK